MRHQTSDSRQQTSDSRQQTQTADIRRQKLGSRRWKQDSTKQREDSREQITEIECISKTEDKRTTSKSGTKDAAEACCVSYSEKTSMTKEIWMLKYKSRLVRIGHTAEDRKAERKRRKTSKNETACMLYIC
jgi:hypothetical protein